MHDPLECHSNKESFHGQFRLVLFARTFPFDDGENSTMKGRLYYAPYSPVSLAFRRGSKVDRWTTADDADADAIVQTNLLYGSICDDHLECK